MLTESVRPLSDAERRLYRQRMALPAEGTVYWMRNEKKGMTITFGVAIAIGLIGAITDWVLVAASVTILWVAVRIAQYFERRKFRKFQTEFRNKLNEDLDTGLIRVIHCRPERGFRREEFEDEGEYYIFDGGSGRYLALIGQDFHETPRFPSDDFEVLLGARHSILFAIRCLGSKLSQLIKVPGDELPWDEFPKRDVILFDAPPNAPLRDLLRAIQTKG